MNPKRIFALIFALAFFSLPLFSQDKKAAIALPQEKLTPQGRVAIIRSLNAELGFARVSFPFGRRGLTLKDGVLSPSSPELETMVATYGPSIKPGDRARITDVKFKDKSIIFELNGGPIRKKKWYEHVTVGGMGGEVTPGSQQQQQPTGDENFHGSYVELSFDKYVPNLTPEQTKQLLDPVLNFHAKSATEAYLETIPPKAKEAIKNHNVLVGMNREMVEYAKGRPPRRTREKDATGTEYEEWIYGTPPEEVQFIRFNGDEVTRVETMKVDGTKLVKTEKEIVLQPEQPELAEQGGQVAPAAGADQQGSDKPSTPSRPSLKRPGEDTGQPGGPAPADGPNQNPPIAPQQLPTQGPPGTNFSR